METQMRQFNPAKTISLLVLGALAMVALLAPVSPGQYYGYVTNAGGDMGSHIKGSVSVIDLATNTVIDKILAGSGSIALAVHPDGSVVYVSNIMGGTVAVLDTKTHQVVDTRTLEPITTVEGLVGPLDVSVHPEGTRIYVTNSESDSVSVLDATTYEVITSIPVGRRPHGFGEVIGPGVPRLLMDDAAARLGAVKDVVAAGAEGVNSPQQALASLETALRAGDWTELSALVVDARSSLFVGRRSLCFVLSAEC